ncbi:hypothetical protein B566_EDAN014648, partial [Ephemera danica]
MALLGLCMLLTPALAAFNLDLRFPSVYHSQVANDYFGYSVALYSGGAGKMMVGAPRRNRSEVPDTREPGQAMMCPLHAACSPLPRSYGLYSVKSSSKKLTS